MIMGVILLTFSRFPLLDIVDSRPLKGNVQHYLYAYRRGCDSEFLALVQTTLGMFPEYQ
jgi:hypothetical protein